MYIYIYQYIKYILYYIYIYIYYIIYIYILYYIYIYIYIYYIIYIYIYIQSPPNTFFWKMHKKLLNIFSNFFTYLKVQAFRLIMENNFIQMAASTGHAVVYTFGPIFQHIIDCVQPYFTNGFTNIFL